LLLGGDYPRRDRGPQGVDPGIFTSLLQSFSMKLIDN